MKVTFGEWLPDLLDVVTPGVSEARNCIPRIDGYESIRSPMGLTNACADRIYNGTWYADKDVAAQTFVGTASKLYKRSAATTLTDVSKSGGYTSTDWQFARWGNWVVACNGYDATQYIDMSSGTNFADLSNAPIANTVDVVGDFLVFGHTVETTRQPTRVRWSGFNAATSYGSDLATQADYQDLQGSGGKIQRVVGGPVGVIFQERAIWTMTYSGPPTIFAFSEVDRVRGAAAKNSVCVMGGQIYFYAHDGFHVFAVGQGSRPIGENRVDKWFLGVADTTRLDEMRGVVDRERQLIIWSFATMSSPSTCNNTLLFYSPTADRWSYAAMNAESIFEVYGPGYNLDTLDLILTDIDSDSINTESRAFLEGALQVVIGTTNHKLGYLEGEPLTARIKTAELHFPKKTRIRRVRPLIEGNDSATVKVASRDTMGENFTWTSKKTQNARGVVPLRVNGRHHVVEVEISRSFGRAYGVEVDET